MIKNSTIRKFIASFLLFVFAISVVPKAYFHDVFANHIDKIEVCADHMKSAHLHQNGINCHFDQLVVSSLYCFAADPIPGVMPPFFMTHHDGIENSYFTHASDAKDSRGPPSGMFI